MTSKPPGWYDDGRGALRWWDGTQWTEHFALPDSDDGAPEEGGIDELPPELAGPSDDADQGGGSGAFGAATEGRKSKLWVVWAVLGVVLLGFVVAIAVIVPLLFLNQATSGSSRPAAEATTTEEVAVVAAVDQYNDAWLSGDCAAYEEVTTQEFRERQGNPDCEAFADSSTFFAETVEDFESTVTGLAAVGETFEVSTSDAYDAFFDDEGNPVDRPQAIVEDYTYTLIPADGGWAIDEVR